MVAKAKTKNPSRNEPGKVIGITSKDHRSNQLDVERG
jgi:hypothetical protein